MAKLMCVKVGHGQANVMEVKGGNGHPPPPPPINKGWVITLNLVNLPL